MNFAVIIPLYNRAQYIAEALDAVLSQSCPPAEVVVVDDGSTDNGPQIVGRYSERVRLLHLPENQGQQAARNLGIANIKSDWVALCDSDDIWRTDHLLRQKQLLESDPQIEFSFSNFQILRNGQIETVSKFDHAPDGYWDDLGRKVISAGWSFDGNVAPHTIRWHPIFPSATVFSKRLFNSVGPFDTSLRGLGPEDGEFTLRCLYKARVGAVPEPTVLIRKHGGNYTGDQLRLLMDEITALQWIKINHPEAQSFVDIIDSEIIRRSLVATHDAFSIKRHDIIRILLKDVPREEQPPSIRLKGALANMPNAIGLPLNGLLQATSERLKSKRR